MLCPFRSLLGGQIGSYTSWTAVSEFHYLEYGDIGGRSGYDGAVDSAIR
jgi:hypothetical protein